MAKERKKAKEKTSQAAPDFTFEAALRTGNLPQQDTASAASGRLLSLDAFRGLVILLMIFVNSIGGMKGVPYWLEHAKGDQDMYTLTDEVFPWFLFMVGLAIPLALQKRIETGKFPLWSILVRTAGLVFLGVIMVNEEHFDEAATGMSQRIWYGLAYLSAIIFWLGAPRTWSGMKKGILYFLKVVAAAVLIYLVLIFKGKGENGAAAWFVHDWWGILGLIGWAYLGCSLLFLFFRGNALAMMGMMAFMVAMVLGDRAGGLNFLGSYGNLWGVEWPGLCFATHAVIVMAGVVVGLLFTPKTFIKDTEGKSWFLLFFGIGLVAAGYLLRPIGGGFSKINGTAPWGLASAGWGTLLFLLLYLSYDRLRLPVMPRFIAQAGQNALMIYLISEGVGAFYDGNFFGWHYNFFPYWNQGEAYGMANAAILALIQAAVVAFFSRRSVYMRA